MLWQRKMWAVTIDGHLLDQNGQAVAPSGLPYLAATEDKARCWREVKGLAGASTMRVLVTVAGLQ